jgi:hypothetical protein
VSVTPIAEITCDLKLPLNSFAIIAVKKTRIPLNSAGKKRVENKEYPKILFEINAINPVKGGVVAYPVSR